jgi:phage regulator Rha-like protein
LSDVSDILPVERGVIVLRGLPIMLAAEVAAAFGVQTREIGQKIKDNPEKFTPVHAFVVSKEEMETLRSRNLISKRSGRGGSQYQPWALTQKGVVRIATLLRSQKALEATDQLIDIFLEVHTQLSNGANKITVETARSLAPSVETEKAYSDLRTKLAKALDTLLDTPVDRARDATLRDVIADTASSAIGLLRAHLETKGLQNEKLAADTVLVLEQARAISADTHIKLNQETDASDLRRIEIFNARIDTVEKLLKLMKAAEPPALALINAPFMARITSQDLAS